MKGSEIGTLKSAVAFEKISKTLNDASEEEIIAILKDKKNQNTL